MRRPAVQRLLPRYAVAWCYVIAVTVAGIWYTLAPLAARQAVLSWSSTNVHNLHAHPAAAMVASAFFFSPGLVPVWPALIALALFPACGVLGNWRTAVVCVAGHVIGTLVSEGIAGYRIDHGTLPASARYLLDVGPSYIVVAAIAVAILYGGWLARGAALLDLALLAFVGDIFAGLGHLDVAAVGHVTAIATGVLVGSAAYWNLRWVRRRRAAQAAAAGAPADPGPADPADPDVDRPDHSAQPRPRA
ncbi:MAG TPA: rhomboid-like protein [Streptosporangiaceae bacterium]|jgi:hypothetical protein